MGCGELGLMNVHFEQVQVVEEEDIDFKGIILGVLIFEY